ncbi:Ferredoxin [Candidatus Desulfarcum epimagneticum]|uniref:Ferredoxin n=1 Tax=uncultured Desulfobacteraceae bacterium TaxID=218296 RepID=A0A484HLX1_9BACT|nr:Ferredoxin [uncultured Desulfobacteraceae bacterium]
MKKHKLTFQPGDVTVEAAHGENLIRAAMEAGVHINASCGGEGVCGKCRVIVEKGEVKGGITEKLSREDIEKGYRQACLTTIESDVVIRIPVESAMDRAAFSFVKKPRTKAREAEFRLDDLKEEGLFTPQVEKRYLELPEPSKTDNLPDMARLVSHLKIDHGETLLAANLPVIRKTPDVMRENGFKVTATLARPVRENRKSQIINIQGGDATGRNYAIAMDIGTTTLYGQLIDLNTGDVLAWEGDYNGQISYGEDVITRIVFAGKEGGLEKLHDAVVKNINELIQKMRVKSGVEKDDISSITLAGNTTMTQLLLKINPAHIRLSPYVPASTLFPPIHARDLGIDLEDHALALVYPAISSYVGGDIVAGVMASGMYRTEEVTLFIDIGTNAEIVIGNRDWLACAACSAGPAFEGGGITFGMRASKGAIEDFSIDPHTFEPMNITIGNVRPKGVCGSGLITIAAALFDEGVIDSGGKFNRDLDTPRIRETEGIWEYVLAWKEDSQVDRDIVLTEPDIDNLIRAKGAIYSGFMTLLEEVGLGVGDIERIFLAGGFGSYVDLERSMTIGLLPEIDPGKIRFLGNGSLMGAKISSLTNHVRQEVVEVVKKITNFELSETPSYMDSYIAALFLPHTDINLFPNLKQRFAARRADSKKAS